MKPPSRTGLPTSNLQARNSFLVLILKAETLGVVAQSLNIREFQVNPSLVTTNENLLAGGLSGSSTSAVAVESNTGTRETDGSVDGSQRLALGGLSRVLAETLQRVLARSRGPQSECSPTKSEINSK